MAYEALIEQAKKYLTLDNSEFEKYYSKATENLKKNYEASLYSLNKQYTKDKNEAAARTMLNSRNMDQYLAARGLSRSGESVQEKINSSLSLNNTLSELADSNSRQILELAKNKNDSLLSLEEKRINRKDSNEKWATEQAFNIAKAENAKIEREEDIARQAQQLAEERAYQDAVRQEKYAHDMTVMETEQAYKRRTAAEQREYETAKILSQREYEEYVRAYERELEAQIRAEKAQTDAQKAAAEQQYKLDYYREQQRDKERLLEEERRYQEAQKRSDREYAEEKARREREYTAAQKEAEQKNKEQLLILEHEYEKQLKAEEERQKAIREAQSQADKIEYYKIQQADKERLIKEEREYNEMMRKAEENNKKNDEGDNKSSESSQMARNIVASVTGGGKSLNNTKQQVEVFHRLEDLADSGLTQKQLSSVKSALSAYGYTEPSSTEINMTDIEANAKKAYDTAYKDAEARLAKQGLIKQEAQPYAAQNAMNAQLSYLYSHASSIKTFYELCDIMKINRATAHEFLKNKK